MKDVCIIIPIYKELPTGNEIRSIMRCMDVMSGRDIAYIAPDGFDASAYPNAKVETFDSRYFRSREGYSELCCSSELYARFSGYCYVMIYQPDCWIFRDCLEDIMLLDYDYIGAPWYGCRDVRTMNKLPDGTVGNGGLSLRKVSTFLRLAKEGEWSHPEDAYWCIDRGSELRLAPEEIAVLFSLEHNPAKGLMTSGGIVPMGCHRPWQLRYYPIWRALGVPPMVPEPGE